MIPGFSGHLISESFAERLLDAPENRFDVRSSHRAYLQWRQSTAPLGPASTTRAMFEAARPLFLLGGPGELTDVVATESIVTGTFRRDSGMTAIVVTKWGERLDRIRQRALAESIVRGSPWCFATNGVMLRILDAEQPYARRHAEFNLDAAADDERTFNLLRIVLAAPPPAIRAMVDSSRQHESAVCRSLKNGVRISSSQVMGGLLAGRRKSVPEANSVFDQALTIVYRVLFLLFAEARGLVPMWNATYRRSYSIDALRTAAERPGPAPGLWDGMRAIARLAHAGCRLRELRVTPFNGRLFSPARTPLAERNDLDDEAARAAIVALTATPAPNGGRERIGYRDLGVEQLGAIYETLLEYRPRFHKTGPVAVTLEHGGSLRKATGTFYTPQPIADYIVRRTLGPLCERKSADDILKLRIVDPAMGSGAFLVSACRFLSAVCEEALVRDGTWHTADIEEQERAALRRSVAERCLYGVDLNPTAVQLARLSLWLATLAADRPLTFLDHHLVTGNSLVGSRLHSISRPPPFGRTHGTPKRSLPLFDNALFAEPLRETLPTRFALELVPDDTAEQVRHKERALEGIWREGTQFDRWRRVADVWCAPWFDDRGDAIVEAFGALTDAVLGAAGSLPPRICEDLLARAARSAAAERFFHWELEFPEVFFDASGQRRERPGFDAVIGNPPWEMLRADAGAGRSTTVGTRGSDRFARESGMYSACGDGHVNEYQLFTQRAVDLARAGGRIGLVLPFGIVADRGSTALRKRLFGSCDVDGIVGFDNQRAIFPIHRSTRFVLLTASCGRATSSIPCRLGLRDLAALESMTNDDGEVIEELPVTIPIRLVERLSPGDLSIPDVRSRVDLAIVERAANLFAPCGSDSGWRARFGRELNQTDDRELLAAGGRGLPVVEGKHIEPYRVRVAETRYTILERDAASRLRRAPFERTRLCYRDVAGATNRTTLIAALLPAGCVSTHTLFCLTTPLDLDSQQFLCGLFNSLVVNYLVRLRVGTHVTTAIVEALPIPTRAQAHSAFGEIVGAVRSLEQRFDVPAAARVNAAVALLYQLSADEYRHVLGTFPLVPQDERDAALRAFLMTVRT